MSATQTKLKSARSDTLTINCPLKKPPFREAFYHWLAAAAVVVATTAVIGSIGAATVAQQEDEDDDPAHIATTETVVIHNEYLQILLATFVAHSKVFQNRKSVTEKQF